MCQTIKIKLKITILTIVNFNFENKLHIVYSTCQIRVDLNGIRVRVLHTYNPMCTLHASARKCICKKMDLSNTENDFNLFYERANIVYLNVQQTDMHGIKTNIVCIRMHIEYTKLHILSTLDVHL